MKSRVIVSAATAITIALAAAGAFGHGGATGVIKERMELMESIGKAMKSLTAMMRGKEHYDAERVRSLAHTISGHGGENMTKLFPAGSLQSPTEAIPAIWADWERFSALAEQLSAYSTALAAAAGNERRAPGGGMTMGGGLGQGQGMMGQGQARPSAERLSTMPPDAAFMHLAQTCAACHETFRKEK